MNFAFSEFLLFNWIHFAVSFDFSSCVSFPSIRLHLLLNWIPNVAYSVQHFYSLCFMRSSWFHLSFCIADSSFAHAVLFLLLWWCVGIQKTMKKINIFRQCRVTNILRSCFQTHILLLFCWRHWMLNALKIKRKEKPSKKCLDQSHTPKIEAFSLTIACFYFVF